MPDVMPMMELNPQPEQAPRTVRRATAKSVATRKIDETVPRGMIIKLIGREYAVVDCEGDIVEDKVAVVGPNNTLEIADA